MNTDTIILRVWSFSTILRDDGVAYGDYLEQLTYLIFLKMADEYSKPPYNRDLKIPERYSWQTLIDKKGVELETHYLNLLKELGKEAGLIGQIFVKAQNKIQDPAKLYRIIQMINSENWAILGVDVKGTIYEGLLEKNAEDLKSGAGETVRKKMLETTDLHTILRLPTGIFYKPGVKANVIFFDNHPADKNPWTKEVWIYDLRTNMHFTLKENKMEFEDLKDFIECYNPENRHLRKETERFRKFTSDEIVLRDKTSLDIFWLKDNSLTDLDNLPDPDVLVEDIIENLESSLESLREISNNLNKE